MAVRTGVADPASDATGSAVRSPAARKERSLLGGGRRPRAPDRAGPAQLHEGRALERPALPDPNLQGGLPLLVELHGALTREGRGPDELPALPLQAVLDRQYEASR